MKALRAILPVTLLSLIFLIAASILQKLALGVPLVPRGFVAPATTGALLGLLLGIWIFRNRAQSERIRDNARQTEALNAQLLVREKELREVLADKSVLLSEVHHRVRNNLQLLASLLALEEKEHRDAGSEEPARRALLRKVEALSLAYDEFDRPEAASEISLRSFVSNVARSAFASPDPEPPVAFAFDICDCRLDVRQAVPLALLLSEVVSLSADHCHSNGLQGEVSIRAFAVGDTFGMKFSVSCPSKGGGANLPTLQGAKATLLHELALQLRGSLETENEPGELLVNLRFPLSPVGDPIAG